MRMKDRIGSRAKKITTAERLVVHCRWAKAVGRRSVEIPADRMGYARTGAQYLRQELVKIDGRRFLLVSKQHVLYVNRRVVRGDMPGAIAEPGAIALCPRCFAAVDDIYDAGQHWRPMMQQMQQIPTACASCGASFTANSEDTVS